MSGYEKLYKAGAKEVDIRKIKENFEGKSVITSWEDYYWASKCIVDYDMEDFEPKFMSAMLNNSLKYGLTYKTNKEYYLDTIKMLASIYALMGKYQLVLNCLNAVIELDSDAPDWVFHDLVSAQNRTRSIKKNLKRPGMFLSDLAHNDGNKPSTKKKQENIFKEFLAAGIVYITKNPDAIVDIESITDAAMEYGLIDSKEWKTFVAACNGNVSENIKTRTEEIERAVEKPVISKDAIKDQTIETKVKRRPLVISLFPEDDIADSKFSDMENRYNELVERLSSIQDELDNKNKELEAAGLTLEQLTEANCSLEASVKKNLTDMADYERELNEKKADIETLAKRLESAKKGSNERKELEVQLENAQKQKAEMVKQIEAVKQALSESEHKLKDAAEQIQRTAAENRSLKEELQKAQSGEQVFSSNQSAVIIGKWKTIEVITTQKLAKWLSRNLSRFKEWWDKCVIGVLNYAQVIRAQEGHYATLQEFDLAALLRICDKNWSRLCKYNFLTESDRQTVKDMFLVRNNLAHSNVAPLNKEAVVRDLRTMSEFMSVINSNTESKEIDKYAKEVANMKLA